MEKLTKIPINSTPSTDSIDWLLAGLVCALCLIFLLIAIKICYNYSTKFPTIKRSHNEMFEDLNRRGISMKGTRGTARYSVA
ncbi:unnamed protein product [Caenorhabditis bovis]|uniref:Uncharacterized protein n=1 Tax=Caenorhabditis bovis TaxID=2654633 RepID=A0A8S1E9S8_9PELO|nr:unnamed protein product [Caenorhabditis bovis]